MRFGDGGGNKGLNHRERTARSEARGKGYEMGWGLCKSKLLQTLDKEDKLNKNKKSGVDSMKKKRFQMQRSNATLISQV